MAKADFTGFIARLKVRCASIVGTGSFSPGRTALAGGLLTLCLVPSYRLLHRQLAGTYETVTVTPGVMPVCDSPAVRQLLRQAIDSSPQARFRSLSVLTLGAVRNMVFTDGGLEPDRTSWTDPNAALRFCTAMVFTNAGQGDVHFSVKWADASKDMFWLEAATLPW